MANFARTRALWADDTDLLYTEMDEIDEKTSLAINGEGGTYALVDDLVIGGAPGTKIEIGVDTIFHDFVTISESLTVAEDITCLGEITTQRLDVNFDATFDGTETHNGDVTFNNNVIVNDVFYVDAGADFFVYCGAGFYGNLYVEGDAEFNEPVVLNDTVEINGAVAINAPVTLGTGGYIKKNVFIMTDSNVSGGPATGVDEVHVDSGVLSGTRFFTITDADQGAISFSTDEATQLLSVRDPSNNFLCQLRTVGGTGTVYKSAEVRKVGGTWRVTKGEQV